LPARSWPPCSDAQVPDDPDRSAYPFHFRVEKISGDEQLGRFYQTGLADSVLRSATRDGENWIARFGYLLDKKPGRQYGVMYDALIGAIVAPTGCRENDRAIAPAAPACPGGLIQKNDIVARTNQPFHQHSGVDAGSPVMILCYMPQNLGILVERLRINADHATTDIALQNVDRQFRTDPQSPADECVFGKAFTGIEIDIEVFAKATLVERQVHRAANSVNRLSCKQRKRTTVRYGAVRAYDGQVGSVELITSDQAEQRRIGR
jgi:hypothetical protein